MTKKNGNILIAFTIITFLVLAAMVEFCSWVQQLTRANVHRLATQKALTNADTGIQSALEFLRTPQAAELKPGIPWALTSIEQGTTFYVDLIRRASDTSLVDVYATGYYQLNDGSYSSAFNTAGKQAAVYALIQLSNAGDFFAATPGSLEISYGSNISSGSVYANNLTFDSGNGNPQTVVKSASYYNSINPWNYASFVTFLNSGQPVQLTSQPQLPTLDASMSNNYQQMAGPDVLPAGTTLSGLVSPPVGNPYNVFFSPGDITLGAPGANCTLTGSFLIYSQGNIYIANNLNTEDGTTAWPALMAEGNIYVASTAPDTLNVYATMVTNGQFEALGNPRPNGTLNFTGGIVTGGGIALGNIYTLNRNYVYQAPDPTLPLPFATQIISYKVQSGSFNQ